MSEEIIINKKINKGPLTKPPSIKINPPKKQKQIKPPNENKRPSRKEVDAPHFVKTKTKPANELAAAGGWWLPAGARPSAAGGRFHKPRPLPERLSRHIPHVKRVGGAAPLSSIPRRHGRRERNGKNHQDKVVQRK